MLALSAEYSQLQLPSIIILRAKAKLLRVSQYCYSTQDSQNRTLVENNTLSAQNKEIAKETEGHITTNAKDVVTNAIGDFGWWQAGICLCLSFLKFPDSWHQLSIVFLAPPIGNYYCVDGDFNAASYLTYKKQSAMYDQCTYNETHFINETDGQATTISIPCIKWIYDHTIFEETIISEWNLICNRSQLANIAQTTFMLGILLGNVLFGIFADKFGRKKPLLFAIALQVITGIGTAYIPWFEGFILLRFLLAIATGGTMVAGFVMCMEIVGGWWRTTAPVLYHFFFCIGHATLSVFSYYFRHWRHFQLGLSLPSILFLSYWWFVPESPRWLLASGNQKEARKVLSAAAKTNGRTWNENDINSHTMAKKIEGNFLDLLKRPNLRRKILVISFNWLVIGLSFFGVTQYMSRLGGDIFINVAISGVMEAPGTIMCVYSMSRFGRRYTLIASQLLGGFSCLLIVFVPSDMGWLQVALSSLGIVGMASGFTTVFLYTAELFPTVIRNAAVGIASMCARIGSMAAPFITTHDSMSKYIPPLIFGLFPIIGGLLALLLPETLNQLLPETIQEGENSGKRKPKNEEDGKYNPCFIE